MPAHRFDNLLKGGPCGPIYDTVLWEIGELVVAPTLGSIVPHWLLAIPRDPAVNMATWFEDVATLTQLTAEIARRAGYSPEQVLWFEHGAETAGAVTGCGVDHAHLHLLLTAPFSFAQFKAASKSMACLDWQEGTGNPYELIPGAGSYFVAGKGDEYLLATQVESAGSQFFRRIVAALSGMPDSWDYKSYPHLANVELTLHHLRSAA